MRNIELPIAVMLAAAGTAHAQPARVTVDDVSAAPQNTWTYNAGVPLDSDCQPAENCQTAQLTNAYSTTGFKTTEDFVLAESGFIQTTCLQGFFWNGTSGPNYAAADCSDLGTEEWTLTYYRDTFDGRPGTPIGSVTFCTGVGCPINNDPNFVSVTKDIPTGNPDFGGIPIVRISVTHAPLGDDGFNGSTPLQGGDCHYIEWETVNSDDSGEFGCSFYQLAGVWGNARAYQDVRSDGYDICEEFTEDLALCVDLALDNSIVLDCAVSIVDPAYNANCHSALPLVADGMWLSTDTSGSFSYGKVLPDVPGLEGYDLDHETVWYKLTGTGTQVRIDYDSTQMDTVLAAFCGECWEKFYGIIGNDDRAEGDTNSTVVLDTELGRTYLLVCTSKDKCGWATITATDLGVPSTVPADQCGTCDLSAFTGLPIEIDEAALEPCGIDPGTNDGCNAVSPSVGDFIPILPGQRINGTADANNAYDGNAWTLDLDWFTFTVTEQTRVRWSAEAEFDPSVWIVDIGGDITNADCGNTTTLAFDQALRCSAVSIDAQLTPGDYVAVVGPSVFTFNACSTTPDGYGPDTAYDAILDVAPIRPPCSGADLTTQGAGVGDLRYGLPDQIVSGADLGYFVNAWIAGDLAIADVTTTGAGIGDPGFGVPDGQITAADIQFFVNIWIAGCP